MIQTRDRMVWIGLALALGLSGLGAAGRAAPGGFDPFAGSSQPTGAASQPAPAADGSLPGMVPSGPIRDAGPTIARVQFNNDDLSLVFQVVSDATGWSIFTGARVGGKITLYARDISAADLLETAVRMAGFVQVRQGNIISVMTYDDYVLHYGVVKKTFPLQYRDAVQVATVLTPFVTPRGRLIPDPGTRTLVVYEVPTNLPLLEDVVRKIDLPADSRIVKVVKLAYADAGLLGDHLQNVFGPPPRAESAEEAVARVAPPATQPSPLVPDGLLSAEQGVVIWPVPRTNHLILRGYASDLARVEELIVQLDLPEDLETRHYQVVHLLAPDVLASLAESLGLSGATGLAGGARGRGDRSYTARRSQSGPAGQSGRAEWGADGEERVRLSCLEESNAILVTAPAVVQRQVAEFLRLCDTPPVQIAGGIRHYKLQNAAAADVARILLELINQGEQQTEAGQFKVGAGAPGPQITGPSVIAPPSASPAAPAGAAPPVPPAPAAASAGEGPLIGVASQRRTEKPRVTFSEATNTVIIQATVQEHLQFAQVIKELDRQLPQVLLEVVMVDLRGTGDLDIGVELESFQRPGDSVGHLLFTSFGLATVDPATGQRTLHVVPGGTAAITRSEEVPAILHALQNTGRAKIRSAPRMLVNDNMEGLIQSIAEEPYTQVNASTTVATTSFGGFVQAGTQLRMTPHISNDDYLRLEYEITLNSFRGSSANPNLPPARDTSTITSQATVPDGGTLIVAGLTYRNERDTADQLPFVGDIPVLGLLFRRTVTKEEDSRLYVFVRPTILRDSQFRQLRQISDREREASGEPSAYPENPAMDLQEPEEG